MTRPYSARLDAVTANDRDRLNPRNPRSPGLDTPRHAEHLARPCGFIQPSDLTRTKRGSATHAWSCPAGGWLGDLGHGHPAPGAGAFVTRTCPVRDASASSM